MEGIVLDINCADDTIAITNGGRCIMRIPKHSKLGVALSVLRKVDLKADSVITDTYSNCREQGFFLRSFINVKKGYGKQQACSFAENRNSDDIAVQYGIVEDFNDYGVFKSDEKYFACKKCFRYDDAEGAAKFITKWLKG